MNPRGSLRVRWQQHAASFVRAASDQEMPELLVVSSSSAEYQSKLSSGEVVSPIWWTSPNFIRQHQKTTRTIHFYVFSRLSRALVSKPIFSEHGSSPHSLKIHNKHSNQLNHLVGAFSESNLASSNNASTRSHATRWKSALGVSATILQHYRWWESCHFLLAVANALKATVSTCAFIIESNMNKKTASLLLIPSISDVTSYGMK